MTWGKWMEDVNNRRVVESSVMDEDGEIWISTVFLGLDHNFSLNHTFPILFETMIFGGRFDQYQNRYSSWDESKMGHKEVVRLARMGIIWDSEEKKVEANL